MDTPIVEITQFIQAIRDAGYRGTSAAIAELVDNSFEAEATTVDINIEIPDTNKLESTRVMVSDDGTGMSPAVLRTALQFGGSSRFGSRIGSGRYGMGLPNSSVSQARRVDVYTWMKTSTVWWSYLDIDEIIRGNLRIIPSPKRRVIPTEFNPLSRKHGTIVVWTVCDRLSGKRPKPLAKKIRKELGRIFRKHIFSGKKIVVNGTPILPYDPLMLKGRNRPLKAIPYGPPNKYDIVIPNGSEKMETSTVVVRLSELPVMEAPKLTNDEKRVYGVSKQAGVSILRNGREIDYGWYFMGNKRKENYDDWWRCEVAFDSNLDELFGVTHTKQGVNPTEYLLEILTPDIERTAHALNSRVRNAFTTIRQVENKQHSIRLAEERDGYLEPPIQYSNPMAQKRVQSARTPVSRKNLPGLKYDLHYETQDLLAFYQYRLEKNKLSLILNSAHPFFEVIYAPLLSLKAPLQIVFRSNLELLLLAAARADCTSSQAGAEQVMEHFRQTWSNNLAAFL